MSGLLELRLLSAVALSASLAACTTVGPDYRPPAAEAPAAYAGASAAPSAEVGDFWAGWRDPELSALVRHALDGSLDLQQAASKVAQARDLMVAARGAALPSVGVEALGGVVQAESGSIDLPGAPPFIPGNFDASGVRLQGGELGLVASWEPDLFGRNRRQGEAAAAAVEAAQWTLRDGQVLVSAAVADDYLRLRVLQRRMKILRAEEQALTELADVERARVQTGESQAPDLDRRLAARAAAAARLPEVELEQAKLIHALGVLTGAAPDALEPELGSTPAPVFDTPPSLAAGAPSDLLRRRPDIRVAERQLAAATAKVGVATADLYPRITLTGGPDVASAALKGLLSAGGAGWLAAGAVTWPVFAGGRIKANIASAKETRAQALLQYRKAVLAGLQDVEDSLAARDAAEKAIAASDAAVAAARDALEVARHSHAVGLASGAVEVQAEEAWLEAEDAAIQARLARARAAIGLYKALGGGWS